LIIELSLLFIPSKITSALESMIVKEPANETVAGIIELLSKRERIYLRKENVKTHYNAKEQAIAKNSKCKLEMFLLH